MEGLGTAPGITAAAHASCGLHDDGPDTALGILYDAVRWQALTRHRLTIASSMCAAHLSEHLPLGAMPLSLRLS